MTAEAAGVGTGAGGLRESGRVAWRALSRVGHLSIAGVAASALLAVALGVFIPRVAERHAMGARLDSARTLVRVLEQQELVPLIGDHLSGTAYARFDAVVRGGLLGGDNLRVKLWSPDGEIVYSDARDLVGRRFPVSEPLAATFEGVASAKISDLSDEENLAERPLASRLLEFYLPLRDDGRVVGAFEIYQDYEPLASHLAAIRTAVWISVGSGLSILFVFLVLLFAATARAMAREQQAAQDRAEDLEVLLNTSRLLASEPGLERTAPEVLGVLSSRLGLRCAAVLPDGGGTGFALARTGTPRVCRLARTAAGAARDRGRAVERVGDGEAALGHGDDGASCRVLAVPFAAGQDHVGAFAACREAARPFDPRERAVVEGVAAQLAVATENARLFTDLRGMTEARGRLLRQLVDAHEEERRHVVGDLHDQVGQTLTRVLYGIRGSRARLETASSEVADELARLEGLVDELITNLRRYMAAVRPALLEDFGLPEALEAFAREQEEESGLRIDVRVGVLPPLEPAAAITLFRAAQEAVINARKHADPRFVRVDLARRDGSVVLEVTDDGRGIAEVRDGIGLTYMKQRVVSLGGTVDVASRPGAGTTIRVLVPLEGR